MATLKNTIRKAEKLTGQKIQINDVNLHWVEFNNYILSFFPNGRMEENVEATNFYTKRKDLQDDYQSDYFAGTFHDNVTQAFNFINR